MNPTQPPALQPPQTATSGQPTNVNSVLSAMGQNINQLQNVPQQVQQIQGQYNVANDPQVQAMRSAQSDKLKQLFDHDTNLAQTYFPTPQAPGAQPNNPAYTPPSQMVVDPMIGMKAASGQQQATGNEVASISEQIANRKDVLTEGLSKAMQLFQYGLQARQMEQEALATELSTALAKITGGTDLLKTTGGTISPDAASFYGLPEGMAIPGEVQRAISAATGQKLAEYQLNPLNQPLDESVFTSLSKDPRFATLVPLLRGLNPAEQRAVIEQITSATTQKPTTVVTKNIPNWFQQFMGYKEKTTTSQEMPALSGGETSYQSTPTTVSGKVPNMSVPGSTIRVRQKSTGQTGSLPGNEFDPNLYEIIGQ